MAFVLTGVCNILPRYSTYLSYMGHHVMWLVKCFFGHLSTILYLFVTWVHVCGSCKCNIIYCTLYYIILYLNICYIYRVTFQSRNNIYIYIYSRGLITFLNFKKF